MNRDYCVIGIDPAFRKNGFAMCIIDENNELAFTMFKNGLQEFVRWIWQDAPDNAIVGVENSNLQNVTFDMRGTKAVIARKSRNVGKNQAVSQMVVDLCREKWGNENVADISPRQKGAKWDADTFRKATGLTIQTNQDKRDAYKIAHLTKRFKPKK